MKDWTEDFGIEVKLGTSVGLAFANGSSAWAACPMFMTDDMLRDEASERVAHLRMRVKFLEEWIADSHHGVERR